MEQDGCTVPPEQMEQSESTAPEERSPALVTRIVNQKGVTLRQVSESSKTICEYFKTKWEYQKRIPYTERWMYRYDIQWDNSQSHEDLKEVMKGILELGLKPVIQVTDLKSHLADLLEAAEKCRSLGNKYTRAHQAVNTVERAHQPKFAIDPELLRIRVEMPDHLLKAKFAVAFEKIESGGLGDDMKLFVFYPDPVEQTETKKSDQPTKEGISYERARYEDVTDQIEVSYILKGVTSLLDGNGPRAKYAFDQVFLGPGQIPVPLRARR